MIKVYGAPIEEADVGKIVEYLAADLLTSTSLPRSCSQRKSFCLEAGCRVASGWRAIVIRIRRSLAPRPIRVAHFCE